MVLAYSPGYSECSGFINKLASDVELSSVQVFLNNVWKICFYVREVPNLFYLLAVPLMNLHIRIFDKGWPEEHFVLAWVQQTLTIHAKNCWHT